MSDEPRPDPASRGAFDFLTDGDWALVLEKARRARFAAGETIVAEWARRAGLFVLREGFVRVERSGRARGISIARLGPGEVFGEMSLLEDAPASASVVAEEPVAADVVDGAHLETLLTSDPGFSARFYRSLAVALSRRLREINAVLTELGETDVPQVQRHRATRTGHVTERQIPTTLVEAVEQFRAALAGIEAGLGRRALADPQPAVGAACDAVLAALDMHLGDEALTEAGYNDLLAFRDPEQLEAGMGAYVFRETFPLFMASATIARYHTKPRGYPDDAETLERVYAADPEGDGTLGRLIDAWFLSRPLCEARRTARRRVAALLGEAVGASSDNAVPVLSLTARAPRELFDALAAPGGAALHATCIDGDSQALEHAALLARAAGHDGSVGFVHANIVRIVEGHGTLAIRPQRVIYGLGLADTLDDERLAAVLDWAFDRLEPGGRMWLAQTRLGHRDAPFMRHVLEWPVQARTIEDVRRLFGGSRFASASLSAETEPGGVFFFVSATRDR